MEDDFLKVAKEAALEAGKIIQKYSGNFGKKTFKGGDKSNFATKADIAAEKLIIKILTTNFPSHNLIAEEQGKINKNSEYTWAIDPVDGTFAFAHGIPQFCVSIGLLKNNQPFLGVIYYISTKELFWAKKGEGAYMNNRSIRISKTKVLEEAGLYFDFGHRQKRQKKIELYFNPLQSKIGRVFSLGSTALSLVWVGAGKLDSSVAQAWIWDFAAGTVIVREAGGKVTDFEGQEPDWTKERLNIVVSNGLIHDQILEALKV